MYQCISSFEPFRVRTSGLVAGILTGAAGAGLLAEPSFAMAGADNSQTLANPTIAAQPFGPDLDGNQIVDMKDLMIMLAVLNGGDHANPAWVQSADVNGDGVIDHADLSEVIANFGRTITPPPPPPPPTIPAGTISRTREATGSPGVIRPITPPPPPPPPPPTRLMPGDGFTGLFEVPAVVGNPNAPGADAKAIARWNVVPWQTITGEFNVGVVAFHINGIEKVVFSANGGEEVVVTEMTMNPDSDTSEYWVTLDARDFPDGQVEIRAVAYPNNGVPRALQGPIDSASVRNGEHSLALQLDANGSIPKTVRYVSMDGDDAAGNGSQAAPFRTIWKAIQSAGSPVNNLTVYLDAGEYSYGGFSIPTPTAGLGWTTITPAPGVDRSQVRIVRGDGRFRIDRIRLKDVTLDQRDGWLITGYSASNWHIWLEGIDGVGKGPRTLGNNNFMTSPIMGSHFAGQYHTDSQYTEYCNGVTGTMARNIHVSNIGSDGYNNPRLVVNSTVDGIDRGSTNFHPDGVQFYSRNDPIENVIMYNVSITNMKAQGIFANAVAAMRDVAFVNMLIERVGTGFVAQWIDAPTDHLLMWHFTLVNQSWNWRAWDIRNVSIRGSVFQKVISSPSSTQPTPVIDPMWYYNNHIIDAYSHGAILLGVDTTVGDPRFTDPASGVFTPRTDSPLRQRVSALGVRTDVMGNSRGQVATVGAVE